MINNKHFINQVYETVQPNGCTSHEQWLLRLFIRFYQLRNRRVFSFSTIKNIIHKNTYDVGCYLYF